MRKQTRTAAKDPATKPRNKKKTKTKKTAAKKTTTPAAKKTKKKKAAKKTTPATAQKKKPTAQQTTPATPRKATTTTKRTQTTEPQAEAQDGRTVLVRVGIPKERGWFYFIDRDLNVARVAVTPPDTVASVMGRLMSGHPSMRAKIQVVHRTGMTAADRDPRWLYSLSDTCDVCVEPLRRSR